MSRRRPLPKTLAGARTSLVIVEAKLKSGELCDLSEFYAENRRRKLKRLIERFEKATPAGSTP